MSKAPKGAIRTYKEIDALLAKAKIRPVQIHCVWQSNWDDEVVVDQTVLDEKTKRKDDTLNNIVDKRFKSLCLTSFNIGVPETDDEGWFLFKNYWFAYAHHLKMLEKENAKRVP